MNSTWAFDEQDGVVHEAEPGSIMLGTTASESSLSHEVPGLLRECCVGNLLGGAGRSVGWGRVGSGHVRLTKGVLNLGSRALPTRLLLVQAVALAPLRGLLWPAPWYDQA